MSIHIRAHTGFFTSLYRQNLSAHPEYSNKFVHAQIQRLAYNFVIQFNLKVSNTEKRVSIFSIHHRLNKHTNVYFFISLSRFVGGTIFSQLIFCQFTVCCAREWLSIIALKNKRLLLNIKFFFRVGTPNQFFLKYYNRPW